MTGNLTLPFCDFRYTKTIGLTTSKSVSDSVSNDSSLDQSFTAGLKFKIFEAQAAHFETEYDWGKTSSSTFEKTTSTEVDIEVNAGWRAKIQQATGYCGQTTIQTEMFKITSTNKTRIESVQLGRL